MIPSPGVQGQIGYPVLELGLEKTDPVCAAHPRIPNICDSPPPTPGFHSDENLPKIKQFTSGAGDRGIISTSTRPYLVVFYLCLIFSTSTDLVSTSTNLVSTSTNLVSTSTNLVSTSINLVSTSTDHFLAVSCPLVLQPF